MDATTILAWTALGLGLFLGALGTILPGLPGAALIVVGAMIHKWLLPGVLSWWTIGALAVLAILSWIIDIAGGLMGARLGGASRAGLIGAAIGGFVGLAFGLPGLVLGPFVGAIAGDLFAKRRDLAGLLRAGGGAALGFVISLVLRLVILVVMAVTLVVDVFV